MPRGGGEDGVRIRAQNCHARRWNPTGVPGSGAGLAVWPRRAELFLAHHSACKCRQQPALLCALHGRNKQHRPSLHWTLQQPVAGCATDPCPYLALYNSVPLYNSVLHTCIRRRSGEKDGVEIVSIQTANRLTGYARHPPRLKPRTCMLYCPRTVAIACPGPVKVRVWEKSQVCLKGSSWYLRL
jgi:hypothetical protein